MTSRPGAALMALPVIALLLLAALAFQHPGLARRFGLGDSREASNRHFG